MPARSHFFSISCLLVSAHLFPSLFLFRLFVPFSLCSLHFHIARSPAPPTCFCLALFVSFSLTARVFPSMSLCFWFSFPRTHDEHCVVLRVLLSLRRGFDVSLLRDGPPCLRGQRNPGAVEETLYALQWLPQDAKGKGFKRRKGKLLEDHSRTARLSSREPGRKSFWLCLKVGTGWSSWSSSALTARHSFDCET